MTSRERLRADFARYYHYSKINTDNFWPRFKRIIRTEAMWAIAVFRFGQYLEDEASGVTRMLARIPYVISWKLVQYTTGIHLSAATNIGAGLYIGHYGEIWISPKTIMGSNCNISQGVVIGTSAQRTGAIIGDRVWLGPHVVVTGPAEVGSGAVIGANSSVVSKIPENSVAIGVPARVISTSGSSKMIHFPEPGNRSQTHHDQGKLAEC